MCPSTYLGKKMHPFTRSVAGCIRHKSLATGLELTVIVRHLLRNLSNDIPVLYNFT